jgi:hypothetical protein
MLNYDTLIGRQMQTFVYERAKTGLMFLNLRLLQSLNFILPFNTFIIHSLILFNRPLLPFKIKAFLNFGLAVLRTCRL